MKQYFIGVNWEMLGTLHVGFTWMHEGGDGKVFMD